MTREENDFSRLRRGSRHVPMTLRILDCFSHALNWGRQYFGTQRSHTWKYVSALL